MQVVKSIFQETFNVLKGSQYDDKNLGDYDFYTKRFQTKSILFANVATLFMYLVFLPFIWLRIENASFAYINGKSYFTWVIIAFAILGLMSYLFSKMYLYKTFITDSNFKNYLYFNIIILLIINYLSAYVLSFSYFNFYLLIFSVAYFNVAMIFDKWDRLYFNIINIVALYFILWKIHPPSSFKEFFVFAAAFEIHKFFYILGQVFYNLWMQTVSRHLILKNNLNEINSQKSIIEKVLHKQQEILKKLSQSLKIPYSDDNYIDNPVVFSEKIQSLIGELSTLKGELEFSNARYKDIFENVSDGIIIRDARGKIVIANKMVDEITGYTIAELGDAHLKIFIHSNDKDKFEEFNNNLREGKKSFYKGQISTNRGKLKKWVEIHSTPICENGIFKGSRDIIRDVSEEHLEVIEGLQKLEDEKDLLLHFNHKLRTPLNAIIGFSSILKESVEVEEHQETLGHLFESSQILKRLLIDILDLSNLESDSFILQNESHNFYLQNQNIAKEFEKNAKNKNLQFNCNLDQEVNAYYLYDKNYYEKLIANLLNNALENTEKGGIDLEVFKTFMENEIQEYICIRVSDSGMGIKEENKSKIFDKFYVSNKNLVSHNGLGVGLNISKKIVDKMNGHISFQSTYGEGSIFTVHIPLLKSN